MMQAVRGIYRHGVVELLEEPAITGDAEVIVTFLTPGSPLEADDDLDAVTADLKEGAAPLDDFEPIVPATPVLLSDIVLEGRR
jgi:hypothetical protein